MTILLIVGFQAFLAGVAILWIEFIYQTAETSRVRGFRDG